MPYPYNVPASERGGAELTDDDYGSGVPYFSPLRGFHPPPEPPPVPRPELAPTLLAIRARLTARVAVV